tara:strand:+ start:1695 stop:2630 length:936 start_codon:yes stop_codon:yes gene_type:complete
MRSLLLLLLALTSSPVYAIVVTGEGFTLEEAKQQARVLAIETVAGIIIDTERVVSNRELLVNQVLTYSAGYIVKEELLEHYPIGELQFVKLDITVESSKLKNFILSQTEGTSNFDGNSVKLQIESYNKQLTDLDALFDNTLKYHPQQSINTKIIDYQIHENGAREFYLTVTYQHSWNQEYLDALEELVNLVDDGGAPWGTSFLRFGPMGNHHYYIKDIIIMRKINKVFKEMSAVMTVNSMNNEVLINRCIKHDTSQQWLGMWGLRSGLNNWGTMFSGEYIQTNKVTIELTDPTILENASQINIEPVRYCPN